MTSTPAREAGVAEPRSLALISLTGFEASDRWHNRRLAKPTELVLIHNNLDLIPSRLWNILYWLSKDGLEVGERTFCTTFGTLARLIYGPEKRSHDLKYSVIHDSMRQLQETRVILVKQTEVGWVDEVTQSSYIAGFTLTREPNSTSRSWGAGTKVSWEYYSKLESYLLDNTNLALLDPAVYPKLTSKHARSIYELCSVAAMEPTLTVYDIPTAVRLIIGDKDSGYIERRRDFMARCLKPGIKEVQLHSEFDVEPCFVTGPRNSLKGVGFRVKLKDCLPDSMRQHLEQTAGMPLESLLEQNKRHPIFVRMVQEFHVAEQFAIRLLTDFPLDDHLHRYEAAMAWVTHYLIPQCHKKGEKVRNLGASLYKAIAKGYEHHAPVQVALPFSSEIPGPTARRGARTLSKRFTAWLDKQEGEFVDRLWSEFISSATGAAFKRKKPSSAMLFYTFLHDRFPELILGLADEPEVAKSDAT